MLRFVYIQSKQHANPLFGAARVPGLALPVNCTTPDLPGICGLNPLSPCLFGQKIDKGCPLSYASPA